MFYLRTKEVCVRLEILINNFSNLINQTSSFIKKVLDML